MVMKRYKVIVSYDGTNYIGWQTQPQGKGNSIQETIEKVLQDITQTHIPIVASGRTDAKVHATGQVFHFDTDFELPMWKWKMAINGHLPDDIYVLSIEETTYDFHARFSAKGKQYEYKIELGEYDVKNRNYAFMAPWPLDVEKMIDASDLFKGTHDFTAFCGNSLVTHPNQVRTISRLQFIQEGSLLRIIFEGKGFMRYMIRMIVGTLIEVGREKITKEDVSKILESKIKGECRYNAKPYGLTLVEVFYSDEFLMK